MQITRLPNESTADFVARAFRINRGENNETLPGPARPFIKLCDCNQGRLKCTCRETYSASPLPAGALEFRTTATGTLLIDAPTGATPYTPDELRAMGALHDLYQPPRMTRLRAIWYGSGLVFGVVCIAMAVFGTGQ